MECDNVIAHERSEVISRLRTMPERLRSALVRELAVPAVRAKDSQEWSARDVFDHVRATDALHSAQIFMLVSAENPVLPGADERALAERAGFAVDDLETALTSYSARRGELVRLLERLKDAEWQRAGVHPAWGRTTIERYVRHILAHETEHMEQIERLVGRRS